MSKIEETLKKMAAAISKENTQNSSNIEPSRTRRMPEMPGDPNCPICGGLGYVRFDVPMEHPEFGKVQACTCRQAQISQQVGQRLFALSNLNELSHLTFENFQPRGRIGLSPYKADSLERAYNWARIFAKELKGWLLLQGGYGCGKTHLAAAVANFAVGMGVPTLFLTVPDLLDSLRFSFQDPDSTFEDRFDEIRRAPLLILDDFGTQNATPWAQEKLFQIINYRYINQLATVVTTNLPLDEIEERIRSRLMDPALVTTLSILATDYRNPKDDTENPEVSSLESHSDQTFSRFEDRHEEGLAADMVKTLQRATQIATEFAKNPEGWLVFIGPYGCGKTHLAAAIANYRKESGYPLIFITVTELLDHLRATFSPSSSTRYDKLFSEVKSTPLLILDGLGAHSATPWAREKLFQLFDHRYNAKLPTVITMTMKVEELEKSEPQLVSRMLDRRLVTIFPITAPAYHGDKKGNRPTSRRSHGRQP